MTDRYECKKCGKGKDVKTAEAAPPECCGQPMEKAAPLPFCTVSDTAEHARMDHLDEPCDDGRTGKV
jgi:hypothetical protein